MRYRFLRRPASRFDRLAVSTSAALAVVALVGVVAHFVAVAGTYPLGVVAVSPYLMSAALPALVLTAAARQLVGALACTALLVLCSSTQWRLFVAHTAPADALPLRVLTSNLRLGLADPASVVAAVRRDRVDVLMLEELTPAEQARLTAAGLDVALPHHSSQPRTAAGGTGVWSRYPLSAAHHVTGFTFAFVTARVAVPGLPTPPTVVALHLAGPYPDATDWRHDIARVPATLRALPASAPVIVGGDFNATPDTAQFRAVLTGGYRDATQQAGGGVARTYPSDRWFPPLLAIDHVLCRGGAVAVRTSTVEIRGSDHRALLVQLAVGRTT